MAANNRGIEQEIKKHKTKLHIVICLIVKVWPKSQKLYQIIHQKQSRQSSSDVSMPCTCYSLFAGAGHVSWYSVFTVHDHGERLTVVSLLEGWLAAYQHEQDHTKTPDIWGRGNQTETQSEFMCAARQIQVLFCFSNNSIHDQTYTNITTFNNTYNISIQSVWKSHTVLSANTSCDVDYSNFPFSKMDRSY